MFQPVNQKVSHLVVMQIQQLILNGKLKKGDKLPPERKLAEMLNVSRNSLREALGALDVMGVIKRVQGGANVVAADNPEALFMPIALIFKLNNGNIFDVVTFRYIIEAQAVKIVCASCKDDDYRKLEEILEKTKETYDSEELLQLDIGFHKEIINLTKNSLMIYLMQTIYMLIEEQLRTSHENLKITRELTEDVYGNHKRFLEALKIKDIKTALFEIAAGFEESFPHMDFSTFRQCL